MKSALKPALDNLDKALTRLETAVERQLSSGSSKRARVMEEPQLDLSRNERDVNRKIAAKLDQTINRLEMILSEE
jgi:ribosomal protein S21